MSFKFFDEVTGRWKRVSSLLAGAIHVMDAEGNFETQNVEDCLKELAHDIDRIDKNVKYIYDNGTIGGGNGGGGAAVPTIKIDGDLDEQGVHQIVVKSDEVIDIYYFFNSPNPGTGDVELSYGSEVTKQTIKQGRNKWTVGPFPRGTHNLSIVVSDRQGFMSDPARIRVISGALEITSDFSDAKDFNLSQEVEIPYRIHTELPETITAYMSLNGEVTEAIVNKGDNRWRIGQLPTLGVHTAQLQVRSESAVSNVLNYTLVVSDTDNLFVSTTFKDKTFPQGKTLQVDYRISMRGQYQFKSNLYLNGVLHDTVRNPSGVSYWNLGNDLPLGVHHVRIVSMTLDEVHSDELELEIEIVESGLREIIEPTEGMIAKFDSNGKMNVGDKKSIWEDKSGYGVQCNLHNFNYVTNGWMTDEQLKQTVLTFAGRTYAEIDLAPLATGIPTGFTFDIYFKVNNTGNMDARVLSCKDPATPFTGFMIDTEKAILSAKQSVKAQFQEDTWTRVTFVVDRLGRTIRTYTNAIISNVSLISARDESDEKDEFQYNGKVLLGARYDEDGNIVDNSTCSIRTIRMYNRPLTHEEILSLHMYDIKSADELDKIYELNYGEIAIPTMTITGVGIEAMVPSQDPINVKIDYSDPSNPHKRLTRDICQLQIQGTSSKDYPVKNYTLWLRENDGQPMRNYTPVDGWMPEDRWTLKTNYMDSSHANNVGLNKFIHELFKEHPYPQQQINPMTRSNVDGQPIRVIINGKDSGIYTWNIDRYAHNNYGLVTYNEDGTINRHSTAVQYEIAVNSTNGAGAFNDCSWDSIKREFKHRYNYRGDNVTTVEGGDTVLAQGQHSELIDLVTWVNQCTNDEFYADVEKYFSLPHLIDYYLVAYAFGMIDNLGKNMVLTAYGRNEDGHLIWYPSFYDCDSVLGLANNGEIRYDAGVDMDSGSFNTSSSSLWTKLKKMFAQEIKDRYMELRRNRNIDGEVLPPMMSAENVLKYMDGEVMSKIGHIYYNQDAERKYINDPQGQSWLMMCNGQRKEFTYRWLFERFRYLDSVYEASDYLLKSMILRTHVLGNITIRLKTYSPQWVRINYTSSSSKKIYVNKDRYYEFTVNMTNDTENDFTIYGADNLMYVEGIEGLNVSHINISGAEKLIELNVSNSAHIKGLALGSNAYLQKVVCNDCPRLGETETDKTIDLSKCTNLKYFDCSSRSSDKPTKINTVILPSSGGVIETLNLSNTELTSFTMEGQEYLRTLNLNSCKNLDSLVVRNCNGLEVIDMPNTRLSTCVIEGCDNVHDINLSNTKFLTILNLQGCPNLRKLNLSGVLSTNLNDLDLTMSLNLEELDISSTAYINTITFGQYRDEDGNLVNYNSLKVFNCNNSAIKAIRYGKLNPIPDYLDLAGLDLDYVTFNSCSTLREVRNINLVATSSLSPFRYCRELETLQGNISLTGSIDNAFLGCAKLSNIHNTLNLDLTRVTSMSEAFSGCELFTWNEVRFIMSKLSDKYVGTGWRVFSGCIGLKGEVPESLFSKIPNVTSFNEFFAGCTNISGQLPQGLFNNLTKLSSCSYMFSNTSISGNIPNDFFRSPGASLSSTAGMFYNTKLDTAPTSNLFRWNKNLTTVEAMFRHCRELTGSVVSGLFANKPLLSNISYFYSNCPNIYGELPRDLLRLGTPNVLRKANHLLYETDTYGEIPAYISDTDKGLFDEVPLLEDIQYFFSKGMYGDIPQDIFKYNTRLTRVSGLFADNTGITGEIPPKLFANTPNLMLADRLFKNCTEINSEIPRGMFDICTQLTDVAEMFYGCIGLKGQIPERVSEWVQVPSPEDPEIMEDVEIVHEYGLFDNCKVLATVSGLFCGCTNLRSTIPSTLFMSAQNVLDMSEIFARCYELYGQIPGDLFKNCTKVVNMVGAFRDCCKLGKTALELTPEDPYALPEELFANCRALTDINGMFSMWGGVPTSATLRGELPKNLFRNNRNLRNISTLFAGCGLITGPLDGDFFVNNINLRHCTDTFRGPKFTEVGSKLLTNSPSLESIERMFMGNNKVSGPAPKLWLTTATKTAQCFNGCTFDDQDQIPATYK